MKKKRKDPVPAAATEPADDKSATHRVRLPGFMSDEEIGLGDLIKRTTTYLGIRRCAGCERRAAALNRWMVFAGRRAH